MKRIFIAVCSAVMLVAFVPVSAANDGREIAARASELSAALSDVEKRYLHGLEAGGVPVAVKDLQPDFDKMQSHCAWLRRKARVRSIEGIDISSLQHWDHVREMEDVLKDEGRRAVAGYRVLLESGGKDAASFARQCLSLHLQLPSALYFSQNASSRKFRSFQDNFANFQSSSGKKAEAAALEIWQSRIQMLLFYCWSLRRDGQWLKYTCGDNIPQVLPLAQEMADDILSLTSCIFLVPKDSDISKVYRENLVFMMNVSELILDHARRRGGKRSFVRAFQDMEKLDTICRRWQGKINYIFDWGRLAKEATREDVLALLNEQIPVTKAYADALKKAKIANEKAAKAAKYARRKTNNQQGTVPEKEAKNTAAESSVPKPTAPADPFRKAIYEYNLEVFVNSKDYRQAVRDVEKFKNDMVLFVQIMNRFRGGLTAFQQKFPDGLELESQRGGGFGGSSFRRNGPKTKTSVKRK